MRGNKGSETPCNDHVYQCSFGEYLPPSHGRFLEQMALFTNHHTTWAVLRFKGILYIREAIHNIRTFNSCTYTRLYKSWITFWSYGNIQWIPVIVISGFCHKVDENCALLGYYHYSMHNSQEECSSLNPFTFSKQIFTNSRHNSL